MHATFKVENYSLESFKKAYKSLRAFKKLIHLKVLKKRPKLEKFQREKLFL